MDIYIGQVVIFPYNFVPSEFLPCDGRIMLIEQYQALFSLLGFQFGGDGTKTFCLPKLAPIAVGDAQLTYAIAITGIYPSRG